MKRLFATLVVLVAAMFAVPAVATAVNGSEAASQARWAAWNNCPRSGVNYRCLDYNSVIMGGLGGGKWSGQIQVWECWKVFDPFCKNRQSARKGGERYLRINADGSWTFTSNWSNY